MRSTTALLTLVWFLMVLSGPLSAQKLSPAETACVKSYLKKGVGVSAPSQTSCPTGSVLIVVIDEGVPKVIKGGTRLAQHFKSGVCDIVRFYPGSFRPPAEPDPLKPPPYAVTDFCSPTGLAHAYYNGLHEANHIPCPNDNVDEGDCEELATTVNAFNKSCETVGNLLACSGDDLSGCNVEDLEKLKQDFPELLDEDGNLDPDKVEKFAKGLCKSMGDDAKDVDRQKALGCACGSWNSEVADACQVPIPPLKPDDTSYCDDDPPTPPSEAEAPNWPMPACSACDSLG